MIDLVMKACIVQAIDEAATRVCGEWWESKGLMIKRGADEELQA